MGISLTALTGIHSAATARARLTTIEEFLNGGIVQADLATDAWVRRQHIYRPEVRYPNWVRLVSADVHWRDVPVGRSSRSIHHAHQLGSAWQPVANASATITTSATTTVNVLLSMYVWQAGGVGVASPGGDDESVKACDVGIFVNGTQQTGCNRRVFMLGTDALYARKQVTMIKQFSLSAGVHDIQTMLKLNNAEFQPSSGKNYKRVYVDCRNLVIDAQYK